MTLAQPTLDVIKTIINNNVYTTCPELLINALTDSLNDDWLSMHGFDTENDDEDPPTIFKYYLVSSWFGQGMLSIGQPAMELEPGQWIWGRTESVSELCETQAITHLLMHLQTQHT